jgi:hypothetical protein
MGVRRLSKTACCPHAVVLLQVASSSNWRGKGFQATPTLRRGPSSGTTPNTNSQGTHRNLGGHQMTLPSLHAFAGIARVSRPEKLSNTPDLLVMTRGGCSCELPSWPRPGDTPCVFDGHRSERFTFSRQFQQQCAKSSKACTCSYLVIFNIKMPGHAWSQYTSICCSLPAISRLAMTSCNTIADCGHRNSN